MHTGQSDQTATVSEMAPPDMVIKFLLENKIQRGVIDEVIERGYDSLEALSLLDPEDLKTQKIPIGQRRLLLHIAKSLGTNVTTGTAQAGPNPTSASPAAPVQQQTEGTNSDLYHQALLNSLVAQQTQLAGNHSVTPSGAFSSQTQLADHHCGTPSGAFGSNNDISNSNSLGLNTAQPSWQNPQIHIATATGKSNSSHYDIVDFVPHAVEEELVIGGQGEQQVVVKSGPKKPKLENLSLSQWSIANMAILYKLSNEGKLTGPALMDYLSYTTKFYQLVQKCNLTSVLLYDREYRQLQASMGFRWGTDVQHLHILHLQPRDKQFKQGVPSQAPKKGGGNGQTQQFRQKSENRDPGICRNFNSDKGCTFPRCRYTHQCILPGCTQKHPGTTHLGKN